jgi:hypothetical protein
MWALELYLATSLVVYSSCAYFNRLYYSASVPVGAMKI